MAEWLRRVWHWLNRRRFEDALREEMAAHRDEMPEPRRFGNTLRLRDEARELVLRRLRWLDGLSARYARRGARAAPQPRLHDHRSRLARDRVRDRRHDPRGRQRLPVRALPYPQADRLYHVRYAPPGPWEPRGLSGFDWTSVRDVVLFPLDVSRRHVLSVGRHLLADRPRASRLARVRAGTGCAGYSPGWPLDASDWQEGTDAVAMMGHSLWRDRYASDPSVVGRHVRVESEGRRDRPETFRVVGVLPPGFYFGRDSSARVDFLVPLTVPTRTYMVMLTAGVPPSLAERRITDAVRSIASDLPADWAGVVLESVRERYVAELRPVLMAVSIGALLVLLLVWTNVAVLTLLRTLRRQKELAVRVALGSGRAALARMLALEALLSASSLSRQCCHSPRRAWDLAPVIERQLGRPAPGGSGAISIDGSVMLAVGVLGGVVALSLSLLPLIGRWQRRLGDLLGRERGMASDNRAMRHTRAALVVVEVAGTLALLVGGGLMLRSVTGMLRTDLGFDAEALARSRVALRGADYADPTSFFSFYEQFGDRLDDGRRRAGGVRELALLRGAPHVVGRGRRAFRQGTRAGFLRAGPGFFATTGIGLRGGRDFTRADVQSDAPVSSSANRWPSGCGPGSHRWDVGCAASSRRRRGRPRVPGARSSASPPTSDRATSMTGRRRVFSVVPVVVRSVRHLLPADDAVPRRSAPPPRRPRPSTHARWSTRYRR